MRAVSESGRRSSHASSALRLWSKVTPRDIRLATAARAGEGGKLLVELRQRPPAASDAHPRSAIVVGDGVELVGAAFHEHQLDVAADRDDALARFVSLRRRRRQPEGQSQQRCAPPNTMTYP